MNSIIHDSLYQPRMRESHKKIRFPGKFDENEMSWFDWTKHFESVARYNEWNSIHNDLDELIRNSSCNGMDATMVK